MDIEIDCRYWPVEKLYVLHWMEVSFPSLVIAALDKSLALFSLVQTIITL